MKLSTLLLGISLLAAVPAHAGTEGEAPAAPFVTLNPEVTISDGVIRLGDIFLGAGDKADRTVAYSPRPGKRAEFDARWLYRVARAHGLEWRPGSKSDRLVVVRESHMVPLGDIKSMLHEGLLEQGADPDSRAVLSNRDLTLHVPVDSADRVGVHAVNLDAGTGRFSAVVAWGDGDDERSRITGRLEHMIDVPVLISRKMSGDVIRETDIKWLELPQKRLSRNAIVDPARLIGMAVRRTVSAGKPVADNDVRRPLLVGKGDRVTMVLATPQMQITAVGRAIEEGGEGDTISIANTQTNKVVEGVVTGPGQVRIDAPVNLAMR
ncbi:MAG: flagellar basal body P-ring formation protein FlgA [Alphaproteobacteria bacterium]|nr:flagellar basal body P-ring formation protein FlgA [Alphaproteobacteria bacterium]